MAEPKDDPDTAHFVHKVANHLGSSRLEENLNDFFQLHSEELRNDLLCRRRGSLGSAGAGGEEDSGHDNMKNVNANDGEFSLRIHELYREFLQVVQANLEEFLHAEGLTEAELRDACEKEMQAEDPGGLSFMHTLISSWEFSSFVELASDFVEEENDAEEDDDDDDEDEAEDRDDEDEGEEWENSDAQASPPFSFDSRSSPSFRVRELGATVSGSSGGGDNQRRCCERSGIGGTGARKDGDRLDEDAKKPSRGSRSSSRVRVTELLATVGRGVGEEGAHSAPLGTGTLGTAGGTVGRDDSIVGTAVERDRRSLPRTAPSKDAEIKSKTSSSGGVGGTAIPSGVVFCCKENCAGVVAVEERPESDRVGAKARTLDGRSRGARQQWQQEEAEGVVEELSMRAEAKS